MTGVQTGWRIGMERRPGEAGDRHEPEAEVEGNSPAGENSHLPKARKHEAVEHPLEEEKPAVVPFAERMPAAGFLPRQVVEQNDPAHEWGSNSHKGHFSWRWIVGAVVGFVLVVAAVFYMQSRQLKSKTADTAVAVVEKAAPVRMVDLEMNSDQFFFNEHLDRAEKEGREVFLRYARAQTAEEALACIRDQDRLKKAFLKEWKPWGGGANWELERTALIGLTRVDSFAFLLIACRKPDTGDAYVACIVRKGGRMLLDWEASEQRGNVPLDEFLTGEVTQAQMPVRVELANFYTSAFPEADYQSYVLTFANSEEVVWGYARRDKRELEPMYVDLVKKKEAGVGGPGRYTLQLKRESSSSPKKQWLIERILYREWVKP